MTAIWKDCLLRSLEINSQIPSSKFFQLATVRTDGRPTNRTVVYRGFDSDSERILFTTDARTRKVADLRNQPWAEICWYFTETREQYRLSGKISILDHSADDKAQRIRRDVWGNLSANMKEWFLGPPPGKELNCGIKNLDVESPEPAATFMVLQMDVRDVDYLDLINNKRCLYTKSGLDWKNSHVTP